MVQRWSGPPNDRTLCCGARGSVRGASAVCRPHGHSEVCGHGSREAAACCETGGGTGPSGGSDCGREEIGQVQVR